MKSFKWCYIKTDIANISFLDKEIFTNSPSKLALILFKGIEISFFRILNT